MPLPPVLYLIRSVKARWMSQVVGKGCASRQGISVAVTLRFQWVEMLSRLCEFACLVALGAEPRTVDPAHGRVSYTQYEACHARQQDKKAIYPKITTWTERGSVGPIPSPSSGKSSNTRRASASNTSKNWIRRPASESAAVRWRDSRR